MKTIRLPIIAFAPADGAAAAPAVETKTILKQNGIKRPDSGSVTGKLWDIADRISETEGRPALRKEVTDAYMTEVAGANIATANTQYARWVVYHGIADLIKETRKKEAEAAAKAKADEKAKADAKKQADKEAAEAKAKEKAEADAKKAADKQAEKDRKAAEKAEAKAKADAEKAAAKAAK